MREANRKAWLFAVALVTAGMLLIACTTGMHYIETDDTPTVRSFMGYEGGFLNTFHLFYHSLLTYLLYGLSAAFPGVAWVTLLQLLSLWLAGVVMVKSICLCGFTGQGKWGPGRLAGLAFFGAYLFFFYALPTYTTTSALLGAAAVAQLMSLDARREGTKSLPWGGMAGSIGLLVAAYQWRSLSALPALAFWALALVWLAWRHECLRSLAAMKPFLRAAALCAACLGLCVGIRALDIRLQQAEPLVKLNQSRQELFDFTDFMYNRSPAVLDQTGWTKEELLLVTEWYFLDENITAEAFDIQRTAQSPRVPGDAGVAAHLYGAAKLVKDFFDENIAWVLAGGLTVLCAGVYSWLAARRKGPGTGAWLCAPAALLGCGLLWLVLGWNGRIFLRAIASALLPASALMTCLLLGVPWAAAPEGPAERRPPKKGPWRVLAGVLLAGAVLVTALQVQSVLDPERRAFQAVQTRNMETLEDYARDNPNKLVLFSPVDFRDIRLFPDVSEGVPKNLLPWGDWETDTPAQAKQMAQFGLDRRHFTPEDYLRENLVVVGYTYGPPKNLTPHIRSWLGGDIEYRLLAERNGLYFYQFSRGSAVP